MFYLDDYLTVKAGEKITGNIAMRQNARNKVNSHFIFVPVDYFV